MIKIGNDLVNKSAIARASFDGTTLTLNIAGAGQHTYTGDEARAAWDRLSSDVEA